MEQQQTEHKQRKPRVWVVRPVNGDGARLVRARTRGEVREHLSAGIEIEPATHDDLCDLLPQGYEVEEFGKDARVYQKLDTFLIPIAGQDPTLADAPKHPDERKSVEEPRVADRFLGGRFA